MAFRTITTISTEITGQKALLSNVYTIANWAQAHLDVVCLGLDRTQPGFYYTGTTAIAVQGSLENAQKYGEELKTAACETLQEGPVKWAVTSLAAQQIAVNSLVAQRCRFSDLVVLPPPYGTENTRENEAIVEAALFSGNVPVLILPDKCTFPKTIKNIILAWNNSAEALRAARAALPFLKAAENVCITIIDPPAHSPDRSDPGGALGQMLARHGVRAEVSVLAKTLPRISDVLNRYAKDIDAQMVVMGAYGHSRFREAIMGGATRHMLEHAEIPVFMAH